MKLTVILPIVLLLAKGPESLTRAEALMVYGKVRQQYLRINVDMRLERMIVLRSDPSAKYGAKREDKLARYGFWNQYMRNKFPQYRNRVTYVMVPPVIINGDRWGYGYAWNMCSRLGPWPIAMGTATPPQSPTGNGYKWAIKIMAHEIGHLHTAGHDVEGIMMPNYLPEPLFFSRRSRAEIRSCLRY